MITLANIRRAIYNIGKRLDIVDKEQDIIKGKQDNTYNKGEVDQLLSNKANNSINELIPAQASSDNQLADKDFVNSSISTATATYRGYYNLVNDLSLTTQASHGQIEAALATAVNGTPDNNDYAFVQIPVDDLTPTEIFSVERYKFNGTLWSFEYTLNNSGFTAVQWTSLNSNITSDLVAKLLSLINTSYDPQNGSLSSLFGTDSNGNFQNISTSDLTSVLGNTGKFLVREIVQITPNVETALHTGDCVIALNFWGDCFKLVYVTNNSLTTLLSANPQFDTYLSLRVSDRTLYASSAYDVELKVFMF